MLLPAVCLGALVVLQGCGADDRGAPDASALTIAKPDTESGDTQVAPAGTTLARALRVVVTRDDLPVPDVPIVWATYEGSITALSTVTDANGISSARWTLQKILAQQAATASLGTGSSPAVVFTAISTPDPKGRNTVLVQSEGGNRFEPAELTIFVGERVNWFWPEGSSGHNIVPDDGDSPPQSGALAAYPKFHSFQFQSPGVYHYHCMAHGGNGGVGMSGTIVVLPEPGPL
ncbi:MAG: plastocyanin/azurin family copper-binding protein [Gemmatimonadales bacterium]